MAQYIYGKNTVLTRLNEGMPIEKLFLLEQSKWMDVLELAKKAGIEVVVCSRSKLDTLSNGNHQGIVAQIKEYKTYSIDEILSFVEKGKTPLLVMCDGLEDPHNLGAILRTADAVGVDGVIIGKHRSVSLTPTVAKVSTGAIDTVKVAQVTNLTQTLKELKKAGFWVCGADSEKASDYRSANLTAPLVLVVGSEGFGLSRLVKEQCDFTVKIPMVGKVSSLNASVATAVLLYEIFNQRNPMKK
jgi:23S rRNA (guanosine2251-2'-O)-methyltransferase